MKLSRIIAGATLPLLLAGCYGFPGTTYELDDLAAAKPAGSAFTQALSGEYKAFATSEARQFDWLNSQHFARKGLEAAKGTAPAPENPADWSIADADAAKALVAGRARLTAVLSGNAPARFPALTATAQVKYDCWVEQQHEGWQTDDIAACRKDFLAALDTIDRESKPPAPAAAVKPAEETFQLFFDFDRSNLTAAGRKVVAAIAGAAKAENYPKMLIEGYTDTVGSVKYNMALSVRRAKAVRRALGALGVPVGGITVVGHGKTDLLVPTRDGVREPQNRRAVVHFQK